jgi:hypothetical protein
MGADQQESFGKAMTASQTQHTRCAACGQDKHTPLRRDEMGGYVCLVCIDKRLDEYPVRGYVSPLAADLSAILRLYLEKYDALAEEDREMYRGEIRKLSNPLLLVREVERETKKTHHDLRWLEQQASQ